MSLLAVSPAPVRSTPLPVTLAAMRRSTRAVLRSPTLLVAPVAQSLFFLLIYSGQLSAVGSGYLAGGSFISFLLPLILLTGVATGAGARAPSSCRTSPAATSTDSGWPTARPPRSSSVPSSPHSSPSPSNYSSPWPEPHSSVTGLKAGRA
ncbi:hypothetical protein [Salinispora arenicola]|uniref:hypothetical protein n=1 Tax=Salinispora arenicola TaxID=168697 RepID=UPI0027DEAB79|nr:hypothetical protein [Salinispora arenicola]